MANASLPLLHEGDPRLKLTLENRIRNIFVTQLEETRQSENVNHIPVLTEAPSRVLETGVNTLQRTLVLKKQVELDQVDRQLALKREEFKILIQTLTQRNAELDLRHQETKDKAKKFEKFVEDNEVKRRRAIKKYQTARQQNTLKNKDIEDIAQQLRKLKVRQQQLKDRVAKYKIYEDYLMKMLDYLPESYLDYGTDSLIMPLIRRYETLSVTNKALEQRGGQLVEELEQGHRRLDLLKQKHNNDKLMANKELSELQSRRDMLKEQNKQWEMNLLMDQGHQRDQVEEMASLLIAIKNLGEQCYLNTYGPLEDMDLLRMLDMVREYILETSDTERKATRLMEYGAAMTSGTDLAAAFSKGEAPSIKNSNSKTQLKSPSKFSQKSVIST
ncbi:Coiled-coil domain-containing protein 42 [Merluccius polli]|uniref:Coiled-coil domain-containing protein 42 n=1 Tax=Merluccius polli TaxID=89951 RepID=A0AA47P1A0_MERPO|nr:Coiled-coil domain-containing protein 42 [Merluccius polli]